LERLEKQGDQQVTDLREITAKNRVYKIKLRAIASELEALDDQRHLTGLSKVENTSYNELLKSYRGIAMTWIEFRKANGQDTDMISVNWSRQQSLPQQPG
jgi:hypothetical protein